MRAPCGHRLVSAGGRGQLEYGGHFSATSGSIISRSFVASSAARDRAASFLPVDDHGRRDGLRVQRALGEAQELLPGRVVEARVGDPEVLLEADREGLLGVTGVDADELDALVLHLLGDLHEVLGLRAAGAAPRSPEVQDDDLALVVGDVEVRAVQGRARELRRVGALALGDGRDPATAGDEVRVAATARPVAVPTARGQGQGTGHSSGGEQGGAASGCAARAHVKSFAWQFQGSCAPPRCP